MATIGRKAAVADLPGIRLSGSLAWWLWGLVHVAFLVDLRTRIAVMKGAIEVAIYGLPEGIEDQFHALPLFKERFVNACSGTHRFADMDVIRCCDLHEERYVNRFNCEYYEYAGNILRGMGVYVDVVMRSERDDWVQAMILAGLGFGFFSEFSVTMPGLVVKPLIEPEFVREINLVTMRGRPRSPAVGALVRAARGYKWPGALLLGAPG